MSTISISGKDVKNIVRCSFEIAFKKGIYAMVGENGCGKSTLMSLLALLVKPSSIRAFPKADYLDSTEIEICIDGIKDRFIINNGCLTNESPPRNGHLLRNNYRGFYEGSIFYGTRFYDYSIISNVLADKNLPDNLMPVDDFVKDNLSNILHGDKSHYRNLKKIKTKRIADKVYKLAGVPYFLEVNKTLISQYSMSSGECMLISLIDFVNNLLLFARARPGTKVLFLIDEVELALHPAAIDRLIAFFENLINNSRFEIIVYFSTHSSEVIQKISPKNLYLLENTKGFLECINPCYANYAIRNLYVPNGFDYLILVEDELAKCLVEKIIRENGLSASKLICVLPGGGWGQLLRLHRDILEYNALGVGKKIISIYDGDVSRIVQEKSEFSRLPKLFLPINSIEKYLKRKLSTDVDLKFMKLIGDKYFNQRRIADIVKEYEDCFACDKSGKKLYALMVDELASSGIMEKDFIKYLCDDIYSYESLASHKFTNSLRACMQ